MERVTVAFDGGPASDAALAWVIDRAATVAMHLEITAVQLETDAEYGAEGGLDSPLQGALDSAVQRVHDARPTLVVTTRIRQGIPVDELIGASAHCDLLVIGTNKTTPIVGVIHGTLPLKIAGRSGCTTVVVPAGWRPRAGKVVAGWFNDSIADAALDFAANEAARLSVGLTIVHTWSAPAASPLDMPAPALVVEELLATSRKLLADAAHRVQVAHPELSITQGLHSGSAAVAIVGTATNASLVVVGSRGHGALADLFLGSVSHDVLLNMPTPVAVVPRKKQPVDVYPELVDGDA
ncbi:universal stress protein [soil metagenome]